MSWSTSTSTVPPVVESVDLVDKETKGDADRLDLTLLISKSQCSVTLLPYNSRRSIVPLFSFMMSYGDKPPTRSIVVTKTPLDQLPQPDDSFHRAIHRISLSALSHNYSEVESAAHRQRCGVICVTKADCKFDSMCHIDFVV